MTVLLIKLAVLIVSNFHQPIFYPKGVGKILVEFMLGNLYNPVSQVFAVKQLFPRYFIRTSGSFILAGNHDQGNQGNG